MNKEELLYKILIDNQSDIKAKLIKYCSKYKMIDYWEDIAQEVRIRLWKFIHALGVEGIDLSRIMGFIDDNIRYSCIDLEKYRNRRIPDPPPSPGKKEDDGLKDIEGDGPGPDKQYEKEEIRKYVDYILKNKLSERDRNILNDYIANGSQTYLAVKYELSKSNIHRIIKNAKEHIKNHKRLRNR